MMTSRIMENMLSFVIDILLCDFENIKSYMLHEIETGKGQWIRVVNRYRNTLDISWEEMKNMEKKQLKIKIREYNTKMQKEGMLNKTPLKGYRLGKKGIGYDLCYSNNINSTYLAKARINSLQLEDHFGRGIMG